MLRVLVVDDQDLFRGGFAMILDAQPDLTVVGEAADGAEAVRLAVELAPDVVLMDIRMPGMGGVRATQRVCRETSAKVIVLTMFDWSPAGGLGAIHTAELPFVFGTLSFTGIPSGTVTGPVRALSRQMGCAWRSFARSGDPGWPRYHTTSRVTRIWDTPSRIARAPGEAERAVWAGYDFPALSLNF
jgi:chemotaxis response regulator CheB